MTAPMGGDWQEGRCRAAGEALVRILAACGCEAAGRPRWDGAALAVSTDGRTVPLAVGPVVLLQRGRPVPGETAGWLAETAAVRFLLTARPLAAPVEVDADLAARRDLGNPCWAVMYAHKRLAALLSRREGFAAVPPELTEGPGRALALGADRFPAAVRQGARTRDPFPVNRCAAALAADTWRYLHTVAPGHRDRALLAAVYTALGNALGLLGALPAGTV